MISVTIDDLEREVYPQLPLMRELQETYGGELSTTGEDSEALFLDTESYTFLMERAGELHVTQKSSDEVFYISDPTMESVEDMLIAMEED